LKSFNILKSLNLFKTIPSATPGACTINIFQL
jgi:hypothetical protein